MPSCTASRLAPVTRRGAQAAKPSAGACMSSRSLLVLPDDSAKPILDAIATAPKALRVKMFVFSDPALLQAVVAARERGVRVQVILNPARNSGEEDDEATRKKPVEGAIVVPDG